MGLVRVMKAPLRALETAILGSDATGLNQYVQESAYIVVCQEDNLNWRSVLLWFTV